MTQQRIQLRSVEADLAEIQSEVRQVPEFQRQQLPVPAGILGQAVVSEDVGPLLRVREMREFDHRHLLQAQLGGRQHASVPRDDAVPAIHQHRVVEPELPDRACDLRHLRLGMGPRIVGVGDQLRDRPLRH
ncbi:hypothetical protein [Thalassococcus profundi]